MPLSNVAPNRKATGDRPYYNRVEELGQLEGALSRSGSEPDSLLDLYRHNTSNGNVSTNNNDSDVPENMWKPEQDDPEGWIHRDKLAKIESEELQAAGINLANARRQYSKSGRRANSRDRKSEDAIDRREEKKPRLSEPALEEEEDERTTWDLRSPEEIAAESGASQMYAQPVLRKSGSRIPVLTSSPHPVPSERVERETPLPRKRTISNSMSPEDGIAINKTRIRKNSLGQPILEAGAVTPTPGEGTRISSKASSPTKQRVKVDPAQTPSSPTTATGSRKPTPGTARKPSVQNKPATPAGTSSPTQRPGTRGNDMDRPRTAINRPEGDPPWLATMYKPDPRLPPDQQIIPTHARKQQAAQWEDNGAVPKTYDRDFTPIAVHEPEELVRPIPKSPPAESPPEKPSVEANAWPLKPVSSVRSTKDGRPGTSGSITAGYSTMPKVTSPPIIQSPSMANKPILKPGAPARLQEQKQQDEKDDGTVKKGCGCCIVM